jgi:hypothetical protein
MREIMIGLVLLWLVLGLIVGALAIGARLGTHSLGQRVWLILPGIGALGAGIGGALGSLLLSRFYGIATAAWVAVLAVAVGSWLLARLEKRTGA